MIMQFKVMVLEISNQLLESDAYGREEKGLAMHLPTTAYLYASLTAEITPHSSEIKIASSEWLLWVIEEKIGISKIGNGCCCKETYCKDEIVLRSLRLFYISKKEFNM